MADFKKGDKLERPHPHRPDEKLKLTVVEVCEGHSFTEDQDGNPFVLFHEKFESEEAA